MAKKTEVLRTVVKAALKQLEVDKILVDGSYQRGLVPKHRKIAAEFNAEAFGVPVVGEREDGSLYVVDGQQRLAALKIRGTKWVRAEVFASRGPEHEAEVFRLINMNRTRLNSKEEFFALLTAHDATAWLVKRVVERHGFAITRGGGTTDKTLDFQLTNLTMVGTLMNIGGRCGEAGLEFVLTTIKAAWPADPLRNNNTLAEGLIRFWNAMNKTVDAERLVNRLQATTPAKILYSGSQGVGDRATGTAEVIGRLYQKRAKAKAV